MNILPPARRIVTGHTNDGKAIFESDISLEPFLPQNFAQEEGHGESTKEVPNDAGFILLWKTDSFPTKNHGPWVEHNNKPLALCDPVGTTIRIVDMPPGLSSPMHRTVSQDIGIVLSGEVVLELDDGAEIVIRQGETVVQRGTIHAWHNRTQQMTRVLFVLLPSQDIKIDGKVLEPTKLSVN